jgi:phenylalanine ammonia-lyase
VDVSVGPLFSKDVIRAAMLVRINMLLKGVSAVKLEDLEIYRDMLNADIVPVVNQYGGIGASGDLAHNCRVLSAARWLPESKVWDKNGNMVDAKKTLQKAGISQLVLEPKAGLGLVNGDNFSTALATLLYVDTLQAMAIHTVTGAMMIEVLKGSDRSFHPLLSEMRPHKGQKEVSTLYRFLLKGSKLAYQEMSGHVRREPGIKVQDGYSLRCLSQYMAVNFEKIEQLIETITINANSASDNPLWVPPDQANEKEIPWQWVSGGNFIAMHMVEVMDALRKIMTQMIKLNDRHLGRLVSSHENNGLPANLSDTKAISQCSFKGVQIQSGMLEVYSTLLSIPVSTFFGVHEEANQDITSHALTSGILGLENLRLLRYSTAQNLLAILQAVDLRGGATLLSPQTQPLYTFLRQKTAYTAKERPLHSDIEYIYQVIQNGALTKLIQEKVFSNY